jgi:hypothetical protein
MKKRLNFTGRKRLASEHIEIRIKQENGASFPSFDATLEPTLTVGLDKAAKIYIEPYVVSSSMRFDFGTVGNPTAPTDTTLSQLDRTESFLFRVKVVDESGHVGRILADANGIRPKDASDDGENRKSLFPVEWVDLGERIWKVAFDKDTGPVLQLTTKVQDLPERRKNDPLLQGAIYPEAFRQVLTLLIEGEGLDHEAPWVCNWHEFVLKLSGVDLSEDIADEDQEQLIEDAVQAFSRAHNFAARANKVQEVPA